MKIKIKMQIKNIVFVPSMYTYTTKTVHGGRKFYTVEEVRSAEFDKDDAFTKFFANIDSNQKTKKSKTLT